MTERSVSTTAAQLGLSQPTVSHALQKLRRVFGDPLLIRSGTGMIPTERAISIGRSVEGILDEYDRLTTPQKAFDPRSARRRFVLTAPEYAEHILLSRLFKYMRDEAPGISVEVRAPDLDRGLQWLERGEVDLRVAWILKPPPSLRSMPLFNDRIVCVVDRDHPIVQGSVTIAQYLSLPHIRLMGGGRTTAAQVIDSAIEKHGGRSQPMFLVQNALTIPQMIVGTDMIATVPNALAARFALMHSVQIVEAPIAFPRIRYAAYWHERSHRDAGHRWLRSALAAASRGVGVGARGR